MIFSSSQSPTPSSEQRRRGSGKRFELSGAMNRLRASMVGKDSSPLTSTPTTTKDPSPEKSTVANTKNNSRPSSQSNKLINALRQVPAIALIAMFHLMVGIPFGVSYFPMSWSPYATQVTDNEGPFPLPGKEALGIRMFLFSTIVGQVVFTFASKFKNPIGLQMVENVPFCHELSNIVIAHQGYGLNAISTLMVMFGLASIVVGLVFFILGKYHLGRIVYFFPTHVLIGCIGGIGVFIAKTGLEVTIADTFSITNLWNGFSLVCPVLVLEIILRVLEQYTKDKQGKPKYTLLSPIYFCMITPMFYLALRILSVPLSVADDMGYFFPPLDDDADITANTSMWDSIFQDGHLFDLWTVIDIPSVSWQAIWDSLPTLVALTLFSLIHVPINIPAFALSTHTEADMNNELIAHGYSNLLAGMFGGLQNYMAYTQSVLYDKSGGIGRPSGIAVALTTALLFVVGPTIASYIPRCMAGTLLVHVGLDLFLEGVWDSYGKFDWLEYSGIWLIVVVMTIWGMEAAMLAGVIAAVSTYAVQSVAYLSPIRGHMPATTLRSSSRNRPHPAKDILNSPINGRSRILVVQLQGHLFFGNMAHFTETMNQLLTPNAAVNGGTTNPRGPQNRQTMALPPIVVIIDFSLVLGIDSSAGHAILKLKDALLKNYPPLELCIFVTGSVEGFPTEFKLSDQLLTQHCDVSKKQVKKTMSLQDITEETALLLQSIHIEDDDEEKYSSSSLLTTAHQYYTGSQVCDSLDVALILAENALIVRQDPSLLQVEEDQYCCYAGNDAVCYNVHDNYDGGGAKEEREFALLWLKTLCPQPMSTQDAAVLFDHFEREIYLEGAYLWKQHSSSDCMKLLVQGVLISELENEAGTTEIIARGNTIGELGLVNGDARMSSVKCVSEEAILYSLSRSSFEQLTRDHPQVARCIDLICIHYLALRVQHVSNRIFETRCLPI